MSTRTFEDYRKVFQSDVSPYTWRCVSCGVSAVLALIILAPQLLIDLMAIMLWFDATPIQCDDYLACLGNALLLPFRAMQEAVSGAFIFGLPMMGLVAAVIVYASLQLDFVKASDGERLIKNWRVLVGVVALYLLAAVVTLNVGHTKPQGFWAFVALPFVLGWLLAFIPVYILSTGLIFAAVFCLPRAIIFWTTQSKLRAAYSDGENRQTFDAKAVLAGLQQTASSETHARALRKDMHQASAAASAELERLRHRKANLQGSIEQETRRREEAAELSRKMAEMEKLKIEIERLRAER